MTIATSKPHQQSSQVRANGLNKFPCRLGPHGKEGNPSNSQIGLPSPEAAPIDAAGSNKFLFGRFCLLLRSRELLADGLAVPLGNRALDILIVLIEARGRLVTKDELLSRAWPSTFVAENNLQFQISMLRKALGRDRGLIKTESGRGYRFVADVTTEGFAPRAGTARLQDPPSNLPAPASDLVGRDHQLSDVAALVAANRLVTLVGAGGVGKTRLGIEVARRLLPKFADGIWIIELGPLSDPSLIPLAIANALRLSDAGKSPEHLAAALSSKCLLLVLDNCEHLIGAAASIAEVLLHAHVSLHLIATSREPLRVEGEWVYRVPPLDVPADGGNGIEEVLNYSAAKLFFARTCAAEPRAQFDVRTSAAAAKICRHLDGIPLAIELAAARAATLGVEALASRLDERFSLLTDGRRTAPARHQTLRATLDWSYALLPEPERAVMRRLSIFSGSFTTEAASTVAASGEIASSDVLHWLASLVMKSLVASDVGGPVPQYRLLETTRAYAMDKLTESGEFETVARRLAAFETDCNREPGSMCDIAIPSISRHDLHPERRAHARDTQWILAGALAGSAARRAQTQT